MAVAASPWRSLAVVLGVEPLFSDRHRAARLRAGAQRAHGDLRVLALALLAGWGLDELTAGRLRPSRRLAPPGRRLAVPLVVVALRGRPGGRQARGARWRSRGASPTCRRRRPTPSSRRWRPGSSWLLLAGLAAALVFAAARGRWRPRQWPPWRCARAADLLQIGHRAQPGDPDRPRRAAGDRRDPLPASRRPARFAGSRRIGHPAAARRPGDALRALRRARLRLPGRAPLRQASGAPRWRRRWRSSRPTTLARGRRPRALRALSLLSVADLMQDPPASRCACPGCAVAYDGPDARGVPQPGRAAAGVPGGSPAPVAGEDAALRAVQDPDFDPRGVAVTERPAAGLASGRRRRRRARRHGADRQLRARARARSRRRRAPRRSSCSPTSTSPAGRRPSTGATCRSSASTTCCAVCRAGPARTPSSSRYEPASWRAGWIVSAARRARAGVAAVGAAPAAARQ